MEPSTKYKGDLDTLKDELQERYFALFDTTTKVHLMKDKGNPVLEELKSLLDDALSTISEVMVRLEKEPPENTKRSWWECDRWMFN